VTNKNDEGIQINQADDIGQYSPIDHQQNQVLNSKEKFNINNPSEKINIDNEKSKPKENVLSLLNKNPAGYLVLLSGTIHNLMDGIAVGIAFASRKIPVIISTNIAIVLHEIPKEMGDAGVLLQSKFNPWAVLFWNILHNLTNVIGGIIGIALGQISQSSKAYCLGFVAGNFFYISLAEMVPVIMKKKKLWDQILQFGFIILGIGIMFLILLLED
jgi:zinc transporter ZupT